VQFFCHLVLCLQFHLRGLMLTHKLQGFSPQRFSLLLVQLSLSF
jgi:hypothetical protein